MEMNNITKDSCQEKLTDRPLDVHRDDRPHHTVSSSGCFEVSEVTGASIVSSTNSVILSHYAS
jgi:hypothetical protein